MNPVVIDASAGVELATDTLRGRALRALLPADAVPWVPELFFVECGAVLRRWNLNPILTPAQINHAIDALTGWPLRVTEVRGLFADAVYVALAKHIGADLLSDDGRLANAPRLPVRALRLPNVEAARSP